MRPIPRQRDTFAYRIAAPVNQDVVTRLGDEFHQWWKDSGYTWDPYERDDDDERGPMGDWPTIEEFLEERYPAAHRGLMMGQEMARPLLDGVGRHDEDPTLPGQRNFNMLQVTYGDNKIAPYDTGPEAKDQHGYDPREVAAAFLLLHNKTHPLRGYRAGEDQARLDEIAQARNAEFDNADIDVLHDIAQKRHKMQHAASNDYDDTAWWAAGWDDEDDDDDEPAHKTAMPAPAPKGLRFEHDPNFIHPHADYLGRVQAYVDDHPVGHLEWLKEGNPLSIVTDRKPGEVSFIYVHPNYRRHSIASEMFDWAKENAAPDLHHSQRRTDLGEKWVNYEQQRAAAIRMAMPAEDAYDGNWKNRKTSPPIVGPFYHSSDHDLPDGTILLPNQGESKFTDDYERRPGWKERTKWVWMELDPSGGWGEHTYEVEPMDEGPWPWNGDGRTHGYTSPRARIIRKMTPEDQQELMDAFVDRMHEENRHLYARRTAMPAPLPEGITFHYHPDDSTIPAEHYDDFYAPAIEARHHGNYVGHLSWTDGSPEDGGRPVGEINGIMVKPEYQRHSVATAMFDYVRQQHEPAIHHSGFLSADGRSWRDYEESRHKTAMPAPLPEGVTFKYHHTNDSIPEGYSGANQGGSHTFLAPAVAAYKNDKPIAYVEWWPTDKYPNAAKHYRHVMDKGKPGEVYYIYVHPRYRRNSIASEMFRWAQDNVEPDLHHSPKKSELGTKWVSYEESTPELARAAAVIRYAERVAMPLNHIPPMNHFDDRLFKKQLDNLGYWSDEEINGIPDRANLIRSQGGSTIDTAGEHAVFMSFIHHDENGAPNGILHYFPTGSRSAKEKPGGIQVLVHPDHQGKGIGSKLLDAAMAEYGPEAEGFGDYVPIDLDNQNVTPGGNALLQRYLKRTAADSYWEMHTKNKGWIKGRYYSDGHRGRDNLIKKHYGSGHVYQGKQTDGSGRPQCTANDCGDRLCDSRYIAHIVGPDGSIVDHVTSHGSHYG